MKKSFVIFAVTKKILLHFVLLMVLISCLLADGPLYAKRPADYKHAGNKIYADSIKESKIDYLEQIYFSGKNKDGLNTMILEAIQDMNEKNATQGVAAQYVFLSNIKSGAQNAKNACEIEDMLAAGIYNLDAHEAENQKIPVPSQQTNSQLAPALSAASQVGYAAGSTAYTSYYLSNGNYGSGRLGYSAYRGGEIAASGANTVREIDNVKQAFKNLNIGGNKPCKSVPKRDIAIGTHLLPEEKSKGMVLKAKEVSVNITVANVTFDQSKAIKQNIAKIKNVINIKNSSFNSNAVTITLVTDLSMSELSDSVVIVNTGIPMEVTSQAGDEDSYKQISYSVNADVVKDAAGKTYHAVSIVITGLNYEAYKTLSAQLAKKEGIRDVKTSGFVAQYSTYTMSTDKSADELIDILKNMLPKVNLVVSAATDAEIMLSVEDNK